MLKGPPACSLGGQQHAEPGPFLIRFRLLGQQPSAPHLHMVPVAQHCVARRTCSSAQYSTAQRPSDPDPSLRPIPSDVYSHSFLVIPTKTYPPPNPVEFFSLT